MLKLNPYLYIDQNIANESLEYRIKKLCENLKEKKYDNYRLVDSIQHTLLYANKSGL